LVCLGGCFGEVVVGGWGCSVPHGVVMKRGGYRSRRREGKKKFRRLEKHDRARVDRKKRKNMQKKREKGIANDKLSSSAKAPGKTTWVGGKIEPDSKKKEQKTAKASPTRDWFSSGVPPTKKGCHNKTLVRGLDGAQSILLGKTPSYVGVKGGGLD